MAKKTPTKKPGRKRTAKTSAKKPGRRVKHETNGRHSKSADGALEQIELPMEMIEMVIEETLELPDAQEFEPEPAINPPVAQRLLPLGEELQNLYARYSAGSAFDDHDKAFYFVLDVGGVSRARQLIDHVEEVLVELEEFRA